MFRILIVNTAISTVAYILISVIGLVVVPVLMNAYGLMLFGLITLTRLLLPTGLLGIFDMGVGETTSQVVAKARTTGEWKWANEQMSWLALIALFVGTVVFICLYLGSGLLSGVLRIAPEHTQDFSVILHITALFSPLLFLSLVAEGVIKGFEDYRSVRSIEVVCSLIYGLGSILAAWMGASFVVVAYIALASSVVRAIISLSLALYHFSHSSTAVFVRPHRGLSECWERTRPMATNRVLSTMQMQAAPFLVSVMVGPASVAVYDILMRLPRFAKSVLGLVNSALIPFAARLEAEERAEDLTKLNKAGLPLVAVLTLPPLLGAAMCSEPILRLWLGSTMTNYWPWQSLAFLLPIMTVLVGFGTTTLLSRGQVLGRFNKLLAQQIALQFALSIPLVYWFEERAFIIGQVVGVTITFYRQMELVFQEHKLGWKEIRYLMIIGGIGVVLLCAGMPFASEIASVWELLAVVVLYILFYWVLVWIFLLEGQFRGRIIRKLIEHI